MKKKVLTLIIIFFSFLPLVLAKEIETAVNNAGLGLMLREGPGTNYSKILSIPYKAKVEILSKSNSGNGCENEWMEVQYIGKKGYACSTYLIDFKKEVIEEIPVLNPNPVTDEEFFQYLKSEGFPESYFDKLNSIRKIHPNWVFKAAKSNYSWVGALDSQDVSGRSLLSVNTTGINNGLEGLLSTRVGDYNWETDTFKPYDGLTWKQASRETIAYYLDPRNFLDERQIFMFESLSYSKKDHTLKAVESILYSDFLKQFAPYFIKAAEKTGTSPLFLAALVRQEVGTSSGNIVSNGKAGVLSDGVNYTGYYNFFNIGASSSGDPKLKSLQAAKARGWNSPEKSIVEGANIISINYIAAGQDTPYFQKFNLSVNATKGIWHQYCTNVNALSGPAVSTFGAYRDIGVVNLPFVFYIPVFSNMPAETKLPSLGNPNNRLKEIKVNGVKLSNFSGDNTSYEINVTGSKILVEGTTVHSKAKVEGFGSFELKDKVTVLKTIVTAANGNKKVYEIKVNKIDIPVKPEEPEVPIETNINLDEVIIKSSYKITGNNLYNIALGTSVKTITQNIVKDNVGLSINIKSENNLIKNDGIITNGDIITLSTKNETRNYEVLIYGDVSGTGQINILDIGMIQKYLLNLQNLSGAKFKAADVNRDGKITIVDLGMIQKHILNISYITQS